MTNAPFICVTESHLNPDILDAEISIPGYDIFRSDRVGRTHGGVATYVRKDLVVKSEAKDSNSFCDSLLLHIPQLNLVLVNIYRPPNCPEALFAQTLEFTSVFLRNLEDHANCANTYMVVGDFNFPFLKFSNSQNFVNNISRCQNCSADEVCSHMSSQRRQTQKLLEFSEEFFLDQVIRKPTRNQNILDLCFTNDHSLVHDYQMIINSNLSDHFTICIHLNYETIRKPTVKKRTNHYHTVIPEYDLKNGDEEDWMRLNLLLNDVNWESLLEETSPEESLARFLNILEEKVPLVFSKHPSFSEEDSSSPQEEKFRNGNKIPKPIRNLMRSKAKISKSMLRTKSVAKYSKLRDELEGIESQLKTSYDKRRSGQESEAIRRIKKDPKAFFTYAKKFSKTSSDIGPFFDKDGNPVLDGNIIVEMLRQQYDSVFSIPKEEAFIQNPVEFFSTTEADTFLDNITFDRMDILNMIDKLSMGAAAGPDGIPSILLKKCKNSLVDGLDLMFQKFLKDGNLPRMLKQAFVIPVHKGGSRGIPANFRPVSLTSHIMKTFERVIREKLVCHLEVNNKLNPHQHGFRARRSCLSQLLEHYDRILSILEEGNNVDSIYLDFSKAFDKVDTGVLCHKLKSMGISGKLGVFIHNFLTGRDQVILANGIKSKSSSVRSGVPQGTVLGPILFLILINDIDQDIEGDSFLSLFADDTRIARKVNSEEDIESLQADLEKLYKWQDSNNMQFNSKKFEILRYGKNQDLKNSTFYLTPNQDEIIEEKECLRDLGILMSNDATFSSHVELVCSQVRKKSSWILRTFQCRQSWFLKFMWKTLVQGHVDYCSQLYFPQKPSEIEKIENLQRIFTRKFPELAGMDYWQRLKHLKMNSQERRMNFYRVFYL